MTPDSASQTSEDSAVQSERRVKQLIDVLLSDEAISKGAREVLENLKKSSGLAAMDTDGLAKQLIEGKS